MVATDRSRGGVKRVETKRVKAQQRKCANGNACKRADAFALRGPGRRAKGRTRHARMLAVAGP